MPIHRAVADDDALLGLIAAHAVVEAYDALDIVVPHWSVGRTDIVEFHACEFLQCILHRCAVFAYDVGIVAHHLEPECVAAYLTVDDTAIEGTEAAEGIAREEHVGGGVEGDHGLGPVHHRSEHELQLVFSQRESVAVLYLQFIVADAVEPAEHAEGLLVADDLDVGVVFADEGDGTAVVGLHVVDNEVVNLAVANDLLDMFDVLGEEIDLYGID